MPVPISPVSVFVMCQHAFLIVESKCWPQPGDWIMLNRAELFVVWLCALGGGVSLLVCLFCVGGVSELSLASPRHRAATGKDARIAPRRGRMPVSRRDGEGCPCLGSFSRVVQDTHQSPLLFRSPSV